MRKRGARCLDRDLSEPRRAGFGDSQTQNRSSHGPFSTNLTHLHRILSDKTQQHSRIKQHLLLALKVIFWNIPMYICLECV